MKEMLKSKTIIGFMIFVIGITYVNSVQIRMVENASVKVENKTLIMNNK